MSQITLEEFRRKFPETKKNLREASIDSGRGTFTAGSVVSHTSSGKGAFTKPTQPMKVFPIHEANTDQLPLKKDSKHASEKDNIYSQRNIIKSTGYDCIKPNQYSGQSTASQRHPPSPPVRLRDSEQEYKLFLQRQKSMENTSQSKDNQSVNSQILTSPHGHEMANRKPDSRVYNSTSYQDTRRDHAEHAVRKLDMEFRAARNPTPESLLDTSEGMYILNEKKI